MRWAALSTEFTTRDPTAESAREVFDTVTLGGARASNRSDISRLALNVKADVSSAHVLLSQDPMAPLVHYPTPADIAYVLIDGNHFILDGEFLDSTAGQCWRMASASTRRWAASSPSGVASMILTRRSPFPIDPDFESLR
jgi:cytosine/adenosine deaminase-related metal-dependent hydrolase